MVLVSSIIHIKFDNLYTFLNDKSRPIPIINIFEIHVNLFYTQEVKKLRYKIDTVNPVETINTINLDISIIVKSLIR